MAGRVINNERDQLLIIDTLVRWVLKGPSGHRYSSDVQEILCCCMRHAFLIFCMYNQVAAEKVSQPFQKSNLVWKQNIYWHILSGAPKCTFKRKQRLETGAKKGIYALLLVCSFKSAQCAFTHKAFPTVIGRYAPRVLYSVTFKQPNNMTGAVVGDLYCDQHDGRGQLVAGQMGKTQIISPQD